ncbi:hypothetical protein GCM10009840_14220 [Pseudolysinimonas kribbensis]
MIEGYRRWVEPRAWGLPNWRVVTWFPLLAVLGSVLFIVLEISGTSSGAYWMSFGTGTDPNALLGGPRLIRSDEWLVQQSWIISQSRQGFPSVNETFPGGMDATVLMELPNTDWSTLFRPHMWGYLLLGLQHGSAWQWWIPALGLVSGAYLLLVVLMPRRPLTAALVATAVWLSPIFQWWYGPNSLWPTAWALLALAGTIWMLRDDRLWPRIVWAVVIGWLAVTAAIGLYVPFQAPPVLIFVFCFVGLVLNERPWRKGRLRRAVTRLAPLLIAGAAAIGVVVTWALTRSSVLTAVQSTVYPGARSDPTGQLLNQDPTLLGIAGAPWGQTFSTVGAPTALGPNPSESATAILLAVFVVPGLIYLVVRAVRRGSRVDFLDIAAIAVLLVVLAFLLVPGWDPVARLLLLDKVPVARLRVAFAALLPLYFALVVRRVDEMPSRRLAIVGGISGLAVAILTVVLWRELAAVSPAVLQAARLWPVAAVAIVATVCLTFVPRAAPVAAGTLLVASLVIGAAVNPFYRGVYDLNTTHVGKAMDAVEKAKPGTWVGVGSYLTMALVMQTGVRGFDGVQTYPPEKMWHEIDPGDTDEQVWNRLAHVRWTWGSGEPDFADPQRDQILGNFDACSAFAQKYVDYVVSDEAPPARSCLKVLDDVDQGATEMQIYRVVPGVRKGAP